MIIRVLESGRALEDLGGSRRVLNSPKGSRGVQKGPGGSEQDYRQCRSWRNGGSVRLWKGS